MSVADLKSYGRMCAENDAVRAKAKEIGLENIDGQIEHDESLGLHFSQGDMEALAKEVQGEGELSEEDLAQVSGGIVAAVAASVGAAAAVVSAGAAVASTTGGSGW